MRPKTVKESKRNILRKIPFIWKNLSFLFKICLEIFLDINKDY